MMQTPHFTKIHNRFLLNGFYYNQETLKEVAYNFIKEGDQYERYLGDFLLDWLDQSDFIYLESSGTTATPKKLRFKKQSLVNSAIATGDFFGVSVGDRALHCLPARYIAGKMMLVRAMILGLEIDLISPSKRPFYKNEKSYDFVAMTPMQAYHSLNDLNRIGTLILGGAYVSSALQQALIEKKIKAFETYGMMETLSHIAVRKMTDPPSEFKCLPQIQVSQDHRNCLIVDAPRLGIKNLITNDEVELFSSTHFRLIGRVDHIINSGGVKLHPEQIEQKLSEHLGIHFFIDRMEDSVLGEKVVLVVKKTTELTEEVLRSQLKKCASLEPYEIPKAVVFFNEFVATYSGKIKRIATMSQKPSRILDL